MRRVQRVVPGALVTLLLGLVSATTVSMVALERTRPAVLDFPEHVTRMYGHAPTLAFGVIAALVIRSQPRNREGWLLAVFAVLIAVSGTLDLTALWVPSNELVVRANDAISATFVGLFALILLLFPDGQPPSPRWQPVVLVTFGVIIVGVLLAAADVATAWAAPAETAASFVAPLALVIAGLAALWFRWRRASGQTRQQVKWLALAALIFGLELALGAASMLAGTYGDNPGSEVVGNAIFVLAICLVPIAMGIGMVRHHLYDIDRLISRTLAYGVLLVAAVLLYAATGAVLAGALAGHTTSPGAATLAVSAIGVLGLWSVRQRMVAWADHRVYGTRAEPTDLVAGVVAELAAYRRPADGVAGLAAGARRATRARGAAVRVRLPGGVDGHVAEAGDITATGGRMCVPIRVDGEVVGDITVVDPSRDADGLALLTRLASVAAPAVADIRCVVELRQLRAQIRAGNAELRSSRRRLERAEEDERAHLDEVVRSELLPVVDTLRRAVSTSNERSGETVHAREHVADAAACVRELADGIRAVAHDVLPAVLADRGLAAGLRAHVRATAGDVSLTVHETTGAAALPQLPVSVDAALYMCGRLLIRAMGGGPADLVLDVSDHEVRFAASASVTHDEASAQTRRQALGLLADRLDVLGGVQRVLCENDRVEIVCRIPLDAWRGPRLLVNGSGSASR